MSCVLQKAHSLIGDVEENHCSSQHTACPDHLHIQHIGNAHEQENQHLAADSLKADLAGEVLVRNGILYRPVNGRASFRVLCYLRIRRVL